MALPCPHTINFHEKNHTTIPLPKHLSALVSRLPKTGTSANRYGRIPPIPTRRRTPWRPNLHLQRHPQRLCPTRPRPRTRTRATLLRGQLLLQPKLGTSPRLHHRPRWPRPPLQHPFLRRMPFQRRPWTRPRSWPNRHRLFGASQRSLGKAFTVNLCPSRPTAGNCKTRPLTHSKS